MRRSTRISLCIIALGLSGCFIPIGSKTSSGHRHSDEALAFLDQPGTTRDDVIENLGAPLIQSSDTRTLVYVWYQKPRYLDLTPYPDAEEHPRSRIVYTAPEEYALFIAFDERGYIVAHEIRFMDDRSLEDECRKWNRERTGSGKSETSGKAGGLK